MIRYDLPRPPSTNNLFLNLKSGGRTKSKQYREWVTEASGDILLQGRKSIKGQVVIAIAVNKPDNRRRDISNFIKATEDLLVDMGVIEDDSLVQRISIQWVSGQPFECSVIVQPYIQELAA